MRREVVMRPLVVRRLRRLVGGRGGGVVRLLRRGLLLFCVLGSGSLCLVGTLRSVGLRWVGLGLRVVEMGRLGLG